METAIDQESDQEHVRYPRTMAFNAFCRKLRPTVARILRRYQKPCSASTANNRVKFRGTIKLHGTNVTLVFRDNDLKNPTYQSRNRIITAESDHFDTVAFLTTVGMDLLVEKILALSGVKSFGSLIIAGEYAGVGIQHDLAVSTMDRFFCIFNISIDDVWLDMGRFTTVELPERRIFNILNFKTWEIEIDLDGDQRAVAEMIQSTNDVVAQCPFAGAFGVSGGGEGIVWTIISEDESGVVSNCSKILNFKTRGEHDFATSSPALGSADDKARTEAFLTYALTVRRLEQGVEYMREMKMPIVKTNLESFVKWVVADTLKEEGEVMQAMAANEKSVRRGIVRVGAKFWLERCEDKKTDTEN